MQAPRRLRRHHLIYYLKVFECGGAQIGFLGDITTRGMMVMSERALPVGRSMDLEIQNTSELSSPRRVAVRARSIWCKSDVNPDYYAIGFELEAVSAADEEAIAALIKQIGFDD